MFKFKNTGQKINNLKSENLKLEKDRGTLASKVFDYVKRSEINYSQKSELNQKAVNLTTTNTFAKEQQPSYEAQQAVEFKAKALFELEQVIVGIEQFKQICQ